jgi:hypothetical protein
MSSHDSIPDDARALGLEPLVRALTAPTTPLELVGREDALRAFRRELLSVPRDHRQNWSTPMKPTVVRVRLSGGLAVVGAGLAAAAITFATMAVPQFQNVSSDTALPIDTTTASSTVDGGPSDGSQSGGTEAVVTQAGVEQAGGTQTQGTDTEGTDTDGTATRGPGTQSTGRGPDATGPAAFGLCTAWAAHQRNGAEPTGSVAFQNLATAAGGETGVAAFCAIQRLAAPSTGDGQDSGDDAPEPTGVAAEPTPSATPTDAATDAPTDTGKGHAKHPKQAKHAKPQKHAEHTKHAKHGR